MMKNINYLDHPYWIPKCLNVGRISIPLQIFSYIYPPNLYLNRLDVWKCENSHGPPYYFVILTISESFDTVAFVRILWCSCRVFYCNEKFSPNSVKTCKSAVPANMATADLYTIELNRETLSLTEASEFTTVDWNLKSFLSFPSMLGCWR